MGETVGCVCRRRTVEIGGSRERNQQMKSEDQQARERGSLCVVSNERAVGSGSGALLVWVRHDGCRLLSCCLCAAVARYSRHLHKQSMHTCTQFH